MISLNVQEDSILLHTEPAIVVGEATTVDAIPLEDSPNAVSSGGVYAAIGASDHVNAQKVRFDDGESFQEKLASGKLKGSGDELPLIFSKKLTETTTSIIVNKNANGAAFLLNEWEVIIYVPVTGVGYQTTIYLYAISGDNRGISAKCVDGDPSATNVIRFRTAGDFFAEAWFSKYRFSNNSSAATNFHHIEYFENGVKSSKIEIATYDDAKPLPVGTYVEVRGR